MQWEERLIEMRSALHKLEEFETVSPFSRTFYQLICDWIEECGPFCAGLQEAFATFLDTESARHQAVVNANRGGRIQIIEWLSIRYRAEPALQRLVVRLEAMPSEMSRQESIRQLILAECYHQLGQCDKEIPALKAAIATGGDHPVLYFALGYNLFMGALKRHTRYDPMTNEYTIENRRMFQTTLEDAAATLKAGFSDSPFDAQLHWWIGCIQEALGNVGEARDAFSKAKELDPANFGAEAENRLRDLPRPVLDATSPEEAQRLSQLPPISGDELKKVVQQLKKVRNLTDLMDDKSPQSQQLPSGEA